MALRGETIGTAYVRVLADGKGFKKDLEKQLDDTKPMARRKGEEVSKAFSEGLTEKRGENKKAIKAFAADIDKQFGQLRADAERAGDDTGTQLMRRIQRGIRENFPELEAQAKELSTRITAGIMSDFATTGNFRTSLRRRLKGALVEVNQEILAMQRQQAQRLLAIEREAAEESVDVSRKAFAERQKLARAALGDLEQRSKMLAATEKAADDFEKQWRKDMASIQKDTEKATRNIVKAFDRVPSALDRIRGNTTSLFGLLSQGVKDTDRDRDRVEHFFGTWDEGSRHASDGIGRLFGKGSRNDVINFFGSITGGVTRALTSLGGLVGKAEELAGVFTKAGGGAAGFRAIAGSLAKSGAALAAALVGLVAIMGPATSLIAGLAGAVVAVAGSISFALAGALGALVGAMLPVVGGIAVMTLGIMNLNEETKKAVKEALEPFLDAVRDIGELAGKRIFADFGDQMPVFTKAFKSLRPVILGVADALSDVIGSFADVTESRAFTRFVNTMETFLPNATRSVGQIFANVFSGMLSLFSALTPLTERFLGWLEKITGEFAAWAQTKQGQQALREFFERAGDAASTLGDFIGQAGEAIGRLFDLGEPTGTSIIGDMADKVREFVDWIKANPDTVKDWFADAEEIAGKVGDAIGKVIEILDELDTPENRQIAAAVFGAIAIALEAIRQVIEIMQINALIRGLNELPGAWDKVTGAVSSAASAIGGFLGRLPGIARRVVGNIIEFFLRLPGRIAEFIARLPGIFDRILSRVLFQVGFTIGRIVRFFIELPGKIASAAGNIIGRMAIIWARVVAAVPGIISRVVGFFRDLPGKIAGAIGDLWAKIRSKFEAVPEHAANIVADIVSAFAGLGGKILNAIGSIDIGSLIKWPAGKAGQLAKGFVEGVTSASGGIFVGPQARIIGEAGPEAIVPLNRPLALVDPAVRELSAIAQGLKTPTGGNAITINVYSPQSDPRAVAMEAMNYLATAR